VNTLDTHVRNLVGYGERPPKPHWPGNARLALNFVLNYEEGAENSVLNGDEASEQFVTEVPGPALARRSLVDGI